MPFNLQKRREVAQATLDHFMFTPFAWGTSDCWHIVAFALDRFGIETPKLRKYSTELGAARALKTLKLGSVEQWLDARFERIAPAAALPGDIIGSPGGEVDADGNQISVFRTAFGLQLDKDVIAFANGRADVAPAVALASVVPVTAWRVAPVGEGA